MDTLSLHNKKILVTGVSRNIGIGAAITRRLVSAGASVAYHGYSQYDADLEYIDSDPSFSSTLKNELHDSGGRAYALPPSDLSDPGEPENIIDESVRLLGSLDGIVLNHAYSVSLPLGEWTAEHIDAHLQANVRASMLVIQKYAQSAPERGGSITLFTSGQFLGPMTGEIAYSVSKEAICGLCKQTAYALAEQKIRVNCINPGPTDTGYLSGELHAHVASLFPSGEWGKPDDAARLVQFLQSDFSHWITGQIISSEGGFNRYIP